MNRSKNVEFFRIEMASRTDTTLYQLKHVINDTFSSIRKFEPFDRFSTLQSLYRVLDHQLQDGLMGQQESDRMRFIVRMLWDLKLQIHMIEKEDAQLIDVIGHIITLMLDLHLEGIIYKIVVYLRVCTFIYKMMSQLIAKGIIRSYSTRQRRIDADVKPPIGIVSNCDVCGGLMFNAQRYMHMNDAYFAPSTIRFPYELKTIFDRFVHELQYLDREHSHHFTLDLDQLDRIFEYRFIQSSS